MVSNNKKHTMKSIKNKDMIHPSSRKAQQITRVVLRKDRLEQRQKNRTAHAHTRTERHLWFRHAVPEDVVSLTRPQCHALVEEYLGRYNEEYQSLLALHRPGKVRPKAAREDLLAGLMAQERQEYASGFEIPDFTSPKNLKLLREWDGDVNSMLRIKVIRVHEPKQTSKMAASIAGAAAAGLATSIASDKSSMAMQE
ncbi:translation machinery-associated protein 16 [Lunasporangiospora selenospora]|uniref:Translation machinery-associated protein 16 n=1 Tax=Lunasporangiospora selenospora TaxID=979761 RepID=A0A9P6KC32_9FUNG|nr:translation machinery-associated protein 16 [Lunasporangiospora selenospora]